MTDRRSFLGAALAGAGVMLLPSQGHAETILADPYRPWRTRTAPNAKPVRVRGRVHAAGKGLGRVAVSDGLSVVATDNEGRFDLVTDSAREHVYVSLPSGYEVPVNATGTALFYQRIAPRADGSMDANFELRPTQRDETRHAMLFLADVQTEDALEMQWFHEQTVPAVMQTVRELARPTFGVAVGDIMFDKLALYPEYERAVKRMGVPFFQVLGNHDLDQDARLDEHSAATFSRHFGPRHYSFERGAVHYIVLDDVFWHGAGYIGYLTAEALAWLENDLRLVEPGRTVIVATHIPVLGSRHERDGQRNPAAGMAINNREALYRLLAPYRTHVITGHTHETEHRFDHGIHEHVSGTVCGAWWSGPICADGTPNGYTIYELNDQDVRWWYQPTGLPKEQQHRVYAAGADRTAPDEIVANVWNWDPSWKVVWIEDGNRRGAMSRRVGRDPLSLQLHMGPDLPVRRKWVEPYPTSHLFYAPVSREARDVVVEVTDRFGTVYTARPQALAVSATNR